MTSGATIAEVAAREWDVVVVGAGHNGLTAAAWSETAPARVLA